MRYALLTEGLPQLHAIKAELVTQVPEVIFTVRDYRWRISAGVSGVHRFYMISRETANGVKAATPEGIKAIVAALKSDIKKRNGRT